MRGEGGWGGGGGRDPTGVPTLSEADEVVIIALTATPGELETVRQPGDIIGLDNTNLLRV